MKYNKLSCYKIKKIIPGYIVEVFSEAIFINNKPERSKTMDDNQPAALIELQEK